MTAALAAGQPVDVPVGPTLADGLAVGRVGELPFEIARGRVDRGGDGRVKRNCRWPCCGCWNWKRAWSKGPAPLPLAACLAGKLPELAGRRTVLVLSGGNIDPVILGRVIDKGLVADGRLCRFTAVVSDRPGGLARLAQSSPKAGASIKDIAHDRAFSGPDVTAVNVLCTVETSDREHIQRLYKLLGAKAFRSVPAGGCPLRKVDVAHTSHSRTAC